MKTVEVTLYTYNELSEAAKTKAREEWRSNGLDYAWWEMAEDDAKRIAALMGLDIEEFAFSGFGSQGDGASFTGRYKYRKGSVAAVVDYAPDDKDLHRIAAELYQVQRDNWYGLTVTITRSSGIRYCHENTMEVQVETRKGAWVTDAVRSEVTWPLKQFALWHYLRLESEYKRLTSDDYIDGALSCGGYDFHGDGTMA